MATVLDYLKEYRDISFREMPMTEVDSLALCQLSYLKFDGLVPEVHENLPSVTLATLKKNPEFDKLFADVRYEEVNRALVDAMLSGKRSPLYPLPKAPCTRPRGSCRFLRTA